MEVGGWFGCANEVSVKSTVLRHWLTSSLEVTTMFRSVGAISCWMLAGESV